ncbi:Pleiotropic regulator 1 [Bulinus truncatus]|nr:Pleiotropic regulator 1 [Bulinus truncatus]
MGSVEEVQKHSVHTLVFRSLKRTHDMFLSDQGNPPLKFEDSEKFKRQIKIQDEFGPVKEAAKREVRAKQMQQAGGVADIANGLLAGEADHMRNANDLDKSDPSRALVAVNIGQQQMLVPKKAPTMPKPNWHPPWKLYRVISGHIGWVRCLAVEPGNEWFCSGAADRVIKIWDLATGTLKLTLTGHVSTVRGLAVSARQPYLFSCGEDKMVKCWDLEQNKAIRHYHGHLSACYALDLHPTIDVLVTCGRDATVRVRIYNYCL